MATESKNAPEGDVDVAVGPQQVTVSFEDGVGIWKINEGGSVAARGHWLGQRSFSMSLTAGQTVVLNGTGIMVATADTFTAAWNALTDAS